MNDINPCFRLSGKELMSHSLFHLEVLISFYLLFNKIPSPVELKIAWKKQLGLIKSDIETLSLAFTKHHEIKDTSVSKDSLEERRLALSRRLDHLTNEVKQERRT